MAASYAGGTRNILILGRSGSGKSTLASNIICQKDVFVIQGQTTNAVENVIIHDHKYTINIIDTAGLQGTRERGTKSNSEIMKDIKEQAKKRAREGFNLIIFVLRNNDPFTLEDHKVFTEITKSFKDTIGRLSLLVITGCDGISEVDRNAIVTRFKNDPFSKQFADIMEKGIYCVGLSEVNDIECIKYDMFPIHKIIAEARLVYLHDEIQERVHSISCTII